MKRYECDVGGEGGRGEGESKAVGSDRHHMENLDGLGLKDSPFSICRPRNHHIFFPSHDRYIHPSVRLYMEQKRHHSFMGSPFSAQSADLHQAVLKNSFFFG